MSLKTDLSTHAFHLSPAKFFAWDMRRVVKRTEQDEKIFHSVRICTLYNVCSVQRGMSSTSGGGVSLKSQGYHEYIRGCSVHRGDIMIHVGSNLIKSFQFLLKTPMY